MPAVTQARPSPGPHPGPMLQMRRRGHHRNARQAHPMQKSDGRPAPAAGGAGPLQHGSTASPGLGPLTSALWCNELGHRRKSSSSPVLDAHRKATWTRLARWRPTSPLPAKQLQHVCCKEIFRFCGHCDAREPARVYRLTERQRRVRGRRGRQKTGLKGEWWSDRAQGRGGQPADSDAGVLNNRARPAHQACLVEIRPSKHR